MLFDEQVDISSDESSPSDADDDGSTSKQSNNYNDPPEGICITFQPIFCFVY